MRARRCSRPLLLVLLAGVALVQTPAANSPYSREPHALDAFYVYQELTDVVIIPSSSLNRVKLLADPESAEPKPLINRTLAKAERIRYLEKILATNRWVLTPVSRKFTLATSREELDDVQSIPPPPSPPTNVASTESLDAGAIRFYAAQLPQVLDIYQDLTGRTVLRPSLLPAKEAHLFVNVPITRAEAIWCLDTLLALNDLITQIEDRKFVYAVPRSVHGRLRLPKLATENDPLPAGAPPADEQRAKPLPAGALKFRDADTFQVLDIYAQLTGRKPAPIARNVPAAEFNVRNQQALSYREAAFALEAIAALHRLRFKPVGNDKVTVDTIRN